jgi:hypothetical protein
MKKNNLTNLATTRRWAFFSAAKHIFVIFFLLATLLSVNAMAQTASISVGSASGLPGASVTLSVGFSPSTTSASALQFDLMFSSSLTYVSCSAGAATTAAGKGVYCSAITGGARFLIYGATNAIGLGNVTDIQFIISGSASTGSIPVTISGIVVSDANGNRIASAGTAGSVTVLAPADATAPTVTAFAIPSMATALTVSITSLTATDNVAVTGYLVNALSSAPSSSASGWSATAPTSYTFTSAGSKTLYAWAKDAAGCVSTSRSASTTITLPDTTAPTVTAFAIPSTATSLTVSITSFTATDNVAVTGYLVNASSSAPSSSASGWSATAPTSYTFTTAGSKTLYAWAKDAAGCVSTSRSASTTITLSDTTSPAATITSPTSSATYSTSSSPLNLGGTASDNVAVTQVTWANNRGGSGTATGTSSWSATGITLLSGSNILTITARDGAGNAGTDTLTVTYTPPDTTPPAISGVSASSVASDSAVISWITNESSDSQVEYGTTTAYGDSTPLDSTIVTNHSQVLSGLIPETMYHYRVKSRDTVGNLATSGDFSFSTAAVSTVTPKFVQKRELSITSGSSVSVSFTIPNTAGNLIVAYVVWDNSGPVAVTDSCGNAYTSAIGPTKYYWDRTNAQIFYARNIAGGANTVKVSFSTAVTRYGRLFIHEYSGLDPISPLEAAKARSGYSSSMNTGSLITSTANDLLFAGGESNRTVTSPGAGYTVRSNVYGDITEDRIATSPGSYSATATQNGYAWVIQLVAFKAATSQTVQTMMAVPLITGSEIQSMPASDSYVGVSLVNSSAETATVKFTAVDTMGNAIAGMDIPNPVVRDLKPGEQLATADKQLFGSALSGALSSGYIKIESTTPKIGGYFAIFNSDLSIYKVATISTEPLKSIILPEIAELGNTRITAANAGSQSGVVSVDLIAADGMIRSSVDRIVQPNGAVIADLAADLFPNAVPEVTDYIRVRTTEGLQVFELLQTRTGDVGILSGQNQGAGANTLYAPQYFFGPGAKSALSIVNLDSEGGTVTLRLVGEHARQIGVTRYLPIAPNGKIHIDDPQFFQTSQPKDETQEYLEISSDGIRLTGNLTFSDGKRQSSSFSLPLTADLKNSILFSNAGQNGICSAAVVLLNPGDNDVSAKVELYSGNGKLLAVTADLIPPHARRSRLIADYFPGIAGQDWISGYIKIVTNLPIAAFSSLGNSDSSILSVIPSQDIP